MYYRTSSMMNARHGRDAKRSVMTNSHIRGVQEYFYHAVQQLKNVSFSREFIQLSLFALVLFN